MDMVDSLNVLIGSHAQLMGELFGVIGGGEGMWECVQFIKYVFVLIFAGLWVLVGVCHMMVVGVCSMMSVWSRNVLE